MGMDDEVAARFRLHTGLSLNGALLGGEVLGGRGHRFDSDWGSNK